MLPVNLAAGLERHLQKVKVQHEEDLEARLGCVYLPEALARKYPSAAREWRGNGFFPPPACRSIRAAGNAGGIMWMRTCCRWR
jgi:hypothetical protein